MTLFLRLMIAGCLCAQSLSAKSAHSITIAAARALVVAALSSQERALPDIEAQQVSPPKSARFLFFVVTWKGAINGSAVVGNYAVDPYTGDVWSATSSCDEMINGELRRMQMKMRLAIHLS